MVREGIGVTVMPTLALPTGGVPQGLSVLPLAGGDARRRLVLIEPPAGRSDVVDSFVKLLRAPDVG